MLIDAHTRPAALLGYPVAHSLSPRIHNAAFRAQGVNCVYLALPVPPGALAPALAGLRALHFVGASVTIPHKQAVRPLLDALSPTAQAVGAVNTIVCRGDGADVHLYGDNTDVAGFLAPLAPVAARLMGAECVVFGAGGAARAVVYGLLETYRPRRLTIVARTGAKADALAASFAGLPGAQALHVSTPEAAASHVRAARLLVNATPLGMHPQEAASPWPEAGDFAAGQVVYDLVYNPERTHLLQAAAARGAETIGGLEMLIGQAAAAYLQWTGREMPLDAVRTALKTA